MRELAKQTREFPMAGTHSYNTTGIAARGRIYVGTTNKVYALVTSRGTPPSIPTARSTPAAYTDSASSPVTYCYAESDTKAAPDSTVVKAPHLFYIVRVIREIAVEDAKNLC
jgi:hypothetical protein